jgi:hypothetical protein
MVVSQLALCPSQALLRLRQIIFGFIYNNPFANYLGLKEDSTA